MKFKAVMRTLTISAFVFLGVAGAVGSANAAATHAGCTVTATTVCPDGSDGGAGNG